MNNIKQTVLHSIAQQKLSPLPRYVFYLRRVIFALFIITTVILAALSLAQLLRLGGEGDWPFAGVLGFGVLKQMAFLGGFVWVGLFVLFLALLRLQWWVTPTGHRTSWWKIIPEALMVVALFAGVVLYFDLEERFEQHLTRLLSLPSFSEQKARLWHNPTKGLLAGVVLDVNRAEPSPTLTFMDITGMLWRIHTDAFEPIDWEILKRVDRVSIVGSLKQAGVFEGCAVRPLPQGRFWQNRLNEELAELGVTRGRVGIFSAFLRHSQSNTETNDELLRIYKCTGK